MEAQTIQIPFKVLDFIEGISLDVLTRRQLRTRRSPARPIVAETLSNDRFGHSTPGSDGLSNRQASFQTENDTA